MADNKNPLGYDDWELYKPEQVSEVEQELMQRLSRIIHDSCEEVPHNIGYLLVKECKSVVAEYIEKYQDEIKELKYLAKTYENERDAYWKIIEVKLGKKQDDTNLSSGM